MKTSALYIPEGWAKTTYYKKPETFESSASYFLNTISELRIPLVSCSANILYCLPIYQPLISVLFTMQHPAVWSSWIQWQSFHTQATSLKHLSDTSNADQQKLTSHLFIWLFVLRLGVPFNSSEQLRYGNCYRNT